MMCTMLSARAQEHPSFMHKALSRPCCLPKDTVQSLVRE